MSVSGVGRPGDRWTVGGEPTYREPLAQKFIFDQNMGGAGGGGQLVGWAGRGTKAGLWSVGGRWGVR